jgi:hypothetical protein
MSENLLIADIEALEKSVKKPVERLNSDDCPDARVDASYKIRLKTAEGRSITFALPQLCCSYRYSMLRPICQYNKFSSQLKDNAASCCAEWILVLSSVSLSL